MIKIFDDSGDYFIHRSFDDYGRPVNLKTRFNKFELFTLFSFDKYDLFDEQHIFNKYHVKGIIGITATHNLPSRLLPLIKDLLIQIINSTYLIKDKKYKREVRKILYNEIKHLNLILSINLEYKVYDKIHYFTQYPFHQILFDFIKANENENEFNYEVIQLMTSQLKNSQFKRLYLKMNLNKLESIKKTDCLMTSKPIFSYCCYHTINQIQK